MATGSYRTRLEGDAVRLEAALPTLEEVVRHVEGPEWRSLIRSNAEPVRALAASLPELDVILARALRRAAAEEWPASHQVTKLLRALEKLRARLVTGVIRALPAARAQPMAQSLWELEAAAVCAPRRLKREERAAAIHAALPSSLPAVRHAAAFGRRLEAMFEAPATASLSHEWDPDALVELGARWGPGAGAIDELWARLAQIDKGLEAEVREQAQPQPRRAPRVGVERLLHAEYWRVRATERMRFQLDTPLAPVRTREPERPMVLAWLVSRETSKQPLHSSIPPPRAALFELAWALNQLLTEGARGPTDWALLLALAAAAEDPSSSDVKRMRSHLIERHAALSLGSARQRGWRDPTSLTEALQRLRTVR